MLRESEHTHSAARASDSSANLVTHVVPSYELHESVVIVFFSLIIIPILGSVYKWPTQRQL